MMMAANSLAELNGMLEKSRSQIARALPKHLTAERMMRVAMTAYSKTPALQKCTPVSLVGCVIQASEMGLELTGPLGHAYMVPRYNKNIKGMEANFQIGYRGFIDLAYRSGRVKTFCAHEVRQGDLFDYQFGSDPFVTHKPAATGRGEITHVYAVCLQTNGGIDFEVMSAEDVDEHAKKYSDAADKDYSPWKTAWVEMAKKTVIRRIAKRVPLSIEFAKAAMVDEYHDAGIKLTGETNGKPTLNDLDHEILADEDQSPPPKITHNGPANNTTFADPAEVPNDPAPDDAKADMIANDISELISQAKNRAALESVGTAMNGAKGTIGEERYNSLLTVFQAKFKMLAK